MKSITYYKWLVLAITICSTSVCTAQTKTKEKTENRNNQISSPSDVSISYLYWYVSHKAKLDRINIFQADTASDIAYYKVDFKRVDFYLNQIRRSDFVSEKYIDTLKQAYLAADKKLQLHPQNDGPVPGFEYDPILGIQEESEITQNSINFKVTSKTIKDNQAMVIGKISDTLWIRFELSKIKGKWLINLMHSYFKQP
jgi:hypothetical protein